MKSLIPKEHFTFQMKGTFDSHYGKSVLNDTETEEFFRLNAFLSHRYEDLIRHVSTHGHKNVPELEGVDLDAVEAEHNRLAKIIVDKLTRKGKFHEVRRINGLHLQVMEYKLSFVHLLDKKS